MNHGTQDPVAIKYFQVTFHVSGIAIAALPDCAELYTVNVLTHINYAFGYIDPGSFRVITMDAQTDRNLFQTVAEAKLTNPSLKVFLSVGGWTFSDNGTATQPVFGNIARSAGNRQTFANNVVDFMKTYGYDGIDIDWEYPGAPDRGGTPGDTQNFVLLMQMLRSTFDSSGMQLGLTFTAPSSYWYLRWFDLSGLIKYVDWINLMSYDIHGAWDSLNPIGSYVHAHTNLTEIDLALQLFW
jgi:chitinase